MLRVVFTKIKVFSGGILMLLLCLITVGLVFLCVNFVLSASLPDKVNIAVTNSDGGTLSCELIDRLGSCEKIAFNTISDFDEVSRLVEEGKVEGILTIESNFSSNLVSGTHLLSYTCAEGSESSQAVVETVCGVALALRSELRAKEYAETLLGHELTNAESIRLSNLLSSTAEGLSMDNICKIVFVGNPNGEFVSQTVYSAVRTRSAGITAFAVVLILLQMGSFCGTDEARSVEATLANVSRSKLFPLITDYIALIIVGIFIGITSMLANGFSVTPMKVIAFFAFTLNVSALSLLFACLSASGRVSFAAPFTAFITGLFGGCFINFATFDGTIKTLRFFSPQGLYLECISVDVPNAARLILILTAASAVLLSIVSLVRSQRPLNQCIR